MNNEDSRAVACDGVPIFDGYGGIMSKEDATLLESMWEESENYKYNHTSISNISCKASLDSQIVSASTRAIAPKSASHIKAEAPEHEV